MATLLICPDCGGVRGATETTEAGRPCTCTNPTPSTDVYGAAPGAKICCICGADVTGHRRYKDREGRYYCPSCNQPDDGELAASVVAAPAPVLPPTATCVDCHKTFDRDELTAEDGQMICEHCKGERIAREKRERARIAAAEAEAIEAEKSKKRLIAVSVVVLLLIVALFLVLQLRG